ncbi:hypothetical protein JOF29_006381 [Kribbella aluminosa]|uniref:Uncharacterized protein n=1 Tax=Kribbella aluminosa TaxID=416017 RepID=A0ABS4UUQ0_9ACTN|nr:hypothetical protein [Kribbella aluminosa]
MATFEGNIVVNDAGGAWVEVPATDREGCGAGQGFLRDASSVRLATPSLV